MGSVLERDGRVVWGLSAGAGWKALRSRGQSIHSLVLDGDDPVVDDLGDGVRATTLIHRAHCLPGLHKNVGYGPLLRMLSELLGVSTSLGNLAEFPYDWRRDNRASARALGRFVDARLAAWRQSSGAADARVVFVVHSMGGLVARYYLECLDGRPLCRALITFGTPFRGAPSALEFLCNGYKKLFLDVSELVRSFPSVYQLLPRYPMVVQGNADPQYIDDVEGLPNIDRDRARSARAFHSEIDNAVALRHAEPTYLIQPVVGMKQPTLQSAQFAGGVCTVVRGTPPGWPAEWSDGDGTVPRVSAVPIELSNEFRETFIGQRHASLQVNEHVVTEIASKLLQLQAGGDLANVRAAAVQRQRRAPTLSLDLDDAYALGAPITLRAQTVDYAEPVAALTATVTSLSDGSTQQLSLSWSGDDYKTTIENLPAGDYEIRLSSPDVFPRTAETLLDLFEVMERP
jgi:pimeloyl-ACP methyl ester carboxylesterase